MNGVPSHFEATASFWKNHNLILEATCRCLARGGGGGLGQLSNTFSFTMNPQQSDLLRFVCSSMSIQADPDTSSIHSPPGSAVRGAVDVQPCGSIRRVCSWADDTSLLSTSGVDQLSHGSMDSQRFDFQRRNSTFSHATPSAIIFPTSDYDQRLEAMESQRFDLLGRARVRSITSSRPTFNNTSRVDTNPTGGNQRLDQQRFTLPHHVTVSVFVGFIDL